VLARAIPAGQKKELGSVDVNEFSQIRVVADERVGSATGINIDSQSLKGASWCAIGHPFARTSFAGHVGQ
jgi:hypothetical protein